MSQLSLKNLRLKLKVKNKNKKCVFFFMSTLFKKNAIANIDVYVCITERKK